MPAESPTPRKFSVRSHLPPNYKYTNMLVKVRMVLVYRVSVNGCWVLIVGYESSVRLNLTNEEKIGLRIILSLASYDNVKIQ